MAHPEVWRGVPLSERQPVPILLTLQGVFAPGTGGAFRVSLSTVSPGKGVETDPRTCVGVPAEGLPPPTHTQHPHVGIHTTNQGPVAGWHLRENNTDYDIVSERASPHPGPPQMRHEWLCAVHSSGGGRGCPGWARFGRSLRAQLRQNKSDAKERGLPQQQHRPWL